MARLFHSGAEIDGGVPFGPTVAPDGIISAGTTRDTAVFRSGAASFRAASTGSNLQVISFVNVTTAATSVYVRFYIRAAAAPTTTAKVLTLDSIQALRLRTDGALELFANGASQGSPSAAVTDSNWYRVELKASGTTNTWTSSELLLDGVSVATWSGSVIRQSSFAVQWGFIDKPGASVTINIDDVAINDSTGATNNNYPGAGNVVLLKSVTDSAGGTGWTLGTGTALGGNAHTAVANTPPLGVADLAAGSDVKQIRNATSNANVNYDTNMTTYTAAGIGASDTVNAVALWVATAAPVTTSAKAGTVGLVSNPTIANVALGPDGTAGAFWGGAAAGTYPAGWKWSRGTIADAPAVTKGTAPVMRITQVTASTRIAMVGGMFVYVDYTPAGGGGTAHTRTPADTLSLADTFDRLRTSERTPADTVTLADSVKRQKVIPAVFTRSLDLRL